MNLDWILHPVFQYGLQAAGLALCLYLFFSLKRESRGAGVRQEERQQAVEEAVVRIREANEELRARLQELALHAGMLVPPSPPLSGLNLSKRSQALRMYRRGESTDQIAASLALPRREIELLVKVHHLVLGQP